MKKRILSIAITLIIAFAVLLSVTVQALRGLREADFNVSGNIVSEEEFNTVFHVEEEIRHHPQTTTNTTAILFDKLRHHENVPMPTNPHPFAAALREYMEGYDGVVRAYLVTLDNDGTMGVLTSRTPTVGLIDYDWGEYGYVSSGTLFFIQDGELLQIDASGLFVSGRYNRLMYRYPRHTYIVEVIYKLEFGRFEISTRLEYFSDEYLSYLFDDDYDVVAEFIAERDARAEYAREKYGLVALLPPNFGNMRNTQDQTVQILAMTINCVPSLTTTTTITQAQTNQISVTIGDIPVNFAVGQPTLVDGRVIVPVEFFDLLGFCVRWHPQTQQVRLLGATKMVVITLNSDVFTIPTVDGERSYTLDVPAQVIGGSTMVPIRAILESVGYDVHWDEATQTAIITNLN